MSDIFEQFKNYKENPPKMDMQWTKDIEEANKVKDRKEKFRFWFTTILSVIAIVIAAIALYLQVIRKA